MTENANPAAEDEELADEELEQVSGGTPPASGSSTPVSGTQTIWLEPRDPDPSLEG